MSAVLVTRPFPKSGELAELLRGEGFDAIEAPLAAYEDISFDVPELGGFQALVFTSAHGVEVFTKAARKALPVFLPVFCVGAATAAAASAAGFGRVISADGDGAALVPRILAEKETLGLAGILHPCGEDTAHDLAAPLAMSGIALLRLTVYRARLLDALPEPAERAMESGGVSAVLFFSARAAARFAGFARGKNWLSSLSNAEAFCLSPRIAEEIRGLGWKSVRIAAAPRQDALLGLLRLREAPVPAEPVIRAFGGVPALASALGITATVAKGWEKRGVVPANRLDAILDAARKKRIDTGFLLEKAAARMATDDTKNDVIEQSDRRKSTDRRQRHTAPDGEGRIRTDGYTGPERRSGVDRRTYHERQQERIWAEKMRFLNGTTVSAGLLLCAVLYAIVFLLAPEIVSINREKARLKQMEERMGLLNQEVETLRAEKQAATTSHPGAVFSRQIAKVESEVRDAASTVAAAATSVASQLPAADTGNVNDLLVLLSSLQKLGQDEGGRAAINEAARKLSAALDVAGDDASNFNAAVAIARRQDATLSALLGHVEDRHLAAAAFLLALNELRADLERGRPYAAPFALAVKFARRDIALLEALSLLGPHAETGIKGPAALLDAFRNAAPLIVSARGESASATVRDKAMEKLSSLVTVRRTDDAEGTGTEAVVARAEQALQNRDTAAAVRALQSLEGAPAAAAAPFLAEARASLAASKAADHLSQGILQTLSSAAAGDGFTLETLVKAMKTGFSPENAPAASPPAAAAVPYLSEGLQPDAATPETQLVKPFTPGE